MTNVTGGAVLGVRSNATVLIANNDKGLALEFATYSRAKTPVRLLDLGKAILPTNSL